MSGTARRVLALVGRGAGGHAVLYATVTLVGAVAPVAVAWLTKAALDRITAPGGADGLGAVSAGWAVCAALVALTPQVGQYLRGETDRRVGALAKDELFAAVERFVGLSRFEDPAFLDRLRLAEQCAASPAQLVDSALLGVRTGVLGVGLIGSIAVVNPWFAVLLVAAAVPAVAVEVRLSRQRVTMLWDISPAQRRELFYTTLLGTAEAAKEIRLLGLGGFLRGRMGRELATANAQRRRIDRREVTRQASLTVLAAGISGAGLVWAVTAAAHGRLTVGDVALFLAAVAGTQTAIGGLVAAVADAHRHLLLFGHYRAIVDSGPDLDPPARPAGLPALRRGIELDDVWFRYSDRHPWVLRGVTLFIPHGCTVALVGRNGSGKSTLVKLLCRFYDPVRGRIRWDGVDLRDVPAEELRARIGAVFQDFMAYDFSASDNIAVGDLTALDDPDRVERAARRAGVHDALARLPLGYRTLLTRMFAGDRDTDDPQTGVVLSGGQWQRIALARAMLRDERDLMILDEPSAGLDAEAEHEVHTGLRAVRAGRTSLLVSHRLGAVRDADHIAVLVDGVVTEQGTHDRLAAAGGVYARLYALQAAGYSDAGAGSGADTAADAVAVRR